MGTFAPELSQYWVSARGAALDSAQVELRDDDGAQQRALEELAERVNAARSVV